MGAGARSPLSRRLGLGLGSVLLGLVVAELVARTWVANHAEAAQFRRYASIADFRERGGEGLFVRHAYLGYVPRPGYVSGANRHDSRGFRSEEVLVSKPRDEFRVVCMGGSTTYTQNVEDWRACYPMQLEDELHARGHTRVRVVNAGVPNWTSFEHLVAYEFLVRELEADVVVVLEGVNDLKARLVARPLDYRADNSGYRSFSTNLTMPPLVEHSALWRLLAVNSGWMRPHADLERALDNHTGKSLWGALRIQMIEGTYPTAEMTVNPADAILARTPPIHFERNIETLAVLARRDGAEVLLLTSPSCTERVARSQPAARIFEAGLAEMDEALRRIALRTGAQVHELAAEMPRDPTLYLDEVHQDAAGAKVLAQKVAAAIERLFLEQPRPKGGQ